MGSSPVQTWIFSGFNFSAALVECITAMIFHLLKTFSHTFFPYLFAYNLLNLWTIVWLLATISLTFNYELILYISMRFQISPCTARAPFSFNIDTNSNKSNFVAYNDILSTIPQILCFKCKAIIPVQKWRKRLYFYSKSMRKTNIIATDFFLTFFFFTCGRHLLCSTAAYTFLDGNRNAG